MGNSSSEYEVEDDEENDKEREDGDGQEKTKEEKNNKNNDFSSVVRTTLSEPQFVPFEPYKGAVKNILPSPHVKSPSQQQRRQQQRRKETKQQQQNDHESSSSQDTNSTDGPSIQEKESFEIKSKIKDLEDKLNVQYTINGELKKLLVASVGEDIEARLDFLTVDKARLASDVRNYTERISRDSEEKDKWSVESNCWKSKFLAASLIVNDLSSLESQLSLANKDLILGIEMIIEEHEVLWKNMVKIYENMSSMIRNLHFSKEETFTMAPLSYLDLAEHLVSMTENLKESLFQRASSKGSSSPPQCFSKAQNKLCSLMETSKKESESTHESAILSIAEKSKVHLQRIADANSFSPNSDFKNCAHCQGSVLNL